MLRFFYLKLAINLLRLRILKSGSLAQLGERIAGSDEVSGSIPLGSTNFPNMLICGCLPNLR